MARGKGNLVSPNQDKNLATKNVDVLDESNVNSTPNDEWDGVEWEETPSMADVWDDATINTTTITTTTTTTTTSNSYQEPTQDDIESDFEEEYKPTKNESSGDIDVDIDIEKDVEDMQNDDDEEQAITITVPVPPTQKAAEKKGQNRPRWTKGDREYAKQMHQLHQVCYIGHGVACSTLADGEELQAVAYSLLPASVLAKSVPSKSHFNLLATKLRSQFKTSSSADEILDTEQLIESAATRKASLTQLTIIYVALARVVAKFLKIPPPRLTIAFTPISATPVGDDSTDNIDDSGSSAATTKTKKQKSENKKSSNSKKTSSNDKNSKNSKNSNNNNNNNNNNNSNNNNNNNNNSNNSNNNNSNNNSNNNDKGYRVWAEVFVGDWVTIQLEDCNMDQQYYMSIAPGYVVDVTRRYSPVSTPPLPLSSPIPLCSFNSFNGKPSKLNSEEAELLDREDAVLSVLAHQQMPTSLAAFKNHPTYVLEKHLHKFEAIPPATPIIAHFKGNPVYHRSYVQLMHTAERWLQEGREVKPGEQPCGKKIRTTRSKSKSTKSSADGDDNEEVDKSDEGPSSGLFGEWQTDIYEPPVMVDGVIPTNSYGNVYMYSDDMVPVGCAYLPYTGIQKIAKQLGIQSAPALVGWEYRRGQGYPMIKGIVVAQEHAVLLSQVYFDTMQIKEKEKADKEALAKQQEARQQEKKRRVDAYVDSTYNSSSSSSLPPSSVTNVIDVDATETTDKEKLDAEQNRTHQKAKRRKTDKADNDNVDDSAASVTSGGSSRRGKESKGGKGGKSGKSRKSGEGDVPTDHFHVFPTDQQFYDAKQKTWKKKCTCGFIVDFEKM